MKIQITLSPAQICGIRGYVTAGVTGSNATKSEQSAALEVLANILRKLPTPPKK